MTSKQEILVQVSGNGHVETCTARKERLQTHWKQDGQDGDEHLHPEMNVPLSIRELLMNLSFSQRKHEER